MSELWEEPDCGAPKDESQKIKNKEKANRRTPKSGREPENIYSVKGLEGIWG